MLLLDSYENNVNPIAKLPEGIVLFGQKTLQAVPSALDRINVRRLMSYVKREVSMMASTTLFDPNTEVTWKRFTDLVDRNIIYARVLLKPARATEFFAIDFTIVRSDANL